MKLIINISNDVYARLFDSGIQDNEIAVNDVCKMARALRIGTPLDDVKAEFINSYPSNYMGEPELGGASCHFSLNKVLQILDNIGKESEE